MSIMLFVIVLAASFLVVRVGAIAFQLTGMEWSQAKFQALSCFSGTGYTTREAELIVRHPQRRKIATVLIILGNAGLVTLIATAASAINPQRAFLDFLGETFLPFEIPPFIVPWLNLLLLLLAIWILWKISRNAGFVEKLTGYLRTKVMKIRFLSQVSFEELYLVAEGYGVARVEISKSHRLAEKTLAESELKQQEILVLAIQRGPKMMINPKADAKIQEGDELLCFGKLESMSRQADVEPEKQER